MPTMQISALDEIRSYQKEMECVSCGEVGKVNHRVDVFLCSACITRVYYQVTRCGSCIISFTKCGGDDTRIGAYRLDKHSWED